MLERGLESERAAEGAGDWANEMGGTTKVSGLAAGATIVQSGGSVDDAAVAACLAAKKEISKADTLSGTKSSTGTQDFFNYIVFIIIIIIFICRNHNISSQVLAKAN